MEGRMIEVGDFVRTNNGLLGKVNKIELAGSGLRYAGEFLTDEIIQFDDGKIYERRVNNKNIVNHSKNIIDLIEVGDIVFTEDFPGYDFIYIYDKEMLEALKQDVKDGVRIKSILTKEQYMQNCYTVERKEE